MARMSQSAQPVVIGLPDLATPSSAATGVTATGACPAVAMRKGGVARARAAYAGSARAPRSAARSVAVRDSTQ
eukprot:29952-Pleurochrysis_carterae.AAC.1